MNRPGVDVIAEAWEAVGPFDPSLTLPLKARLLYAVLRRWRGHVLSYDEIAHWLWENDWDKSNQKVQRYIHQLRSQGIATEGVAGIGYRLPVEEKENLEQ